MASKGSEAMVSNEMGDLDGNSLVMHRTGRPGKIEIIATKPLVTQRDLALAYSPGVAAPCLEIAKDPYDRLRLHRPRQPGRRDLQRHRRAGPGRHRRAGQQAGDGRQGGAVQALRRRRLHRPRGRHQGRRRVRQLRALSRADLRRHQPRGHQGAGMLHHRAAPARADGHPDLPRRPARHRHRLGRRPDQRAAPHRPQHQGHQDGGERRGRRLDRLHRARQGDGHAARERHPVRHQGRDLPGPHRGHEPVEERPRRAHQGAHARRGDEGRRRLLRPVGQGRGDQGDGAVDGDQADHLRHGQSRSRDHAGGRALGARRRHHRHRPQRLPQPDQQRAGLPLHLPRRARRARHAPSTRR